MVLLARRALQERFASKQREGTAGEGIELGSQVAVLSGRHFPLFSAGDQGEVVRLDQEALNCDVLFEGATQPVPVALRHLRLVQLTLDNKYQVIEGNENGVRVQSSSCSANCTVGCGSTTCSNQRNSLRGCEPDEWEEGRPQGVRGAFSSAGGGVHGSTASSSMTDLAASPMVFGESPASKGESVMISVSDTLAWQSTLEEGPDASASSPPRKRVTKNKSNQGGGSAEVFTFAGSGTFDGFGNAAAISAALVADVADADGRLVRVETLEARIRQLLERHRVETEALKNQLEKATTFGRQQQERVAALEQHIRKMQSTEPTTSTASTVIRPASAVASAMPASVTAPAGSSLTVSTSMLPIATEGNSSGAGTPARSCCDPSDSFGSTRPVRTTTTLASSASSGALASRPASARLHLSATPSQVVVGGSASPRLASSPSSCTVLGPSVTPPHPSPLSMPSEPVALGFPGSGISPRGSSRRALSASATPTRWACQSVPTHTTAAPRPALFLIARPNGAMQQQQNTPRQHPHTPPGGATPVTPLAFVPGGHPGAQQQQPQEDVPTFSQVHCGTSSGGALSPSRSGAGAGMLTSLAAPTQIVAPGTARVLPVGSSGSVHARTSATGSMLAPANRNPAAAAAASQGGGATTLTGGLSMVPSFGTLERV